MPYLPTTIWEAARAKASSGIAARSVAATSVFQTEHFAIWWSPSDTIHFLRGGMGVDSGGAPRAVRLAADALERAWRGYVDTLGYLPPAASSSSFLWNQPVPAGKYPVEFCNIQVAIERSRTEKFFGVAIPEGSAGRSALLLAADLTSFGGWDLTSDLTGADLGVRYAADWRSALRSTAAHELFHAVQFNYERSLAHSFFEASAVAMEMRTVPESWDYLQFAKKLVVLDSLESFPTTTGETAYPHGWLVQTLSEQLGMGVLRGLWEARKQVAAISPPFVSTLRQVLPAYSNGSFDSILVRHALRVGLTGKRSGWVSSALAPFDAADQFPALQGSLLTSEKMTALPLELGAFQVLVDTTAYTEDRLFVWVPDQGVMMGQAANTASGTQVAWRKGSVRVSPAQARRSVWAFANPGNPAVLWPHAASEASVSHYRTVAAPPRTPLVNGQKLSLHFPDGPVLSGTTAADGQATPLVHVDVWKPSVKKDPFAAGLVGTNGHTLFLEDPDGVLRLSGATLTWSGTPMARVYKGSGDGVWTPVALSGEVISLGDLDLSSPLRLLISPTNSAKAAVQVPRPNPSRQGEAIRFPVLGAVGTERVTILAADGGIVRELQPEAGQTELVWNLRNRENRTVKPGVYHYVWRGVEGAVRGRLLVAE